MTVEMPPVCILAGGMGTRLGSRVATVPKPLVEVVGQPFLLYPLRSLADQGVSHVVLCVGYLGEIIEHRIGTTQFGMAIEYSFDRPGLEGTLGAIRRAQAMLGERFLILYGDTYLRVDYRAVVEDWRASGKSAVMTVLRNENRWGPSNVVVQGGLVVQHSKTEMSSAMKWIDYGLGGLTVSALDLVPADVSDLSQLYATLATRGELRSFEVEHRFYEIGTPAGLSETEQYFRALAKPQ